MTNRMIEATTAAKKKLLHGEVLDTLNLLFGFHPGHRPVHAKGIVCQGAFSPDLEASSLCRAPHLQRESVPVTVRFSDFTGIPDIPDSDPNASPRGMAIRFHLPGGGSTDIVAHSYNGFPAASVEEFLGFLKAMAASGPDAQKPTLLDQFLADHPKAMQFARSPKPTPASFATESFYGIDAFRFIDRDGAARIGRYRIRPVAAEQHLTPEDAAAKARDFLFDEMRRRLAGGPAGFQLSVQLAADGDPIADPSAVWPEDRAQVKLGIISIHAPVAESDAAQQKLVFDPANLADGIELSDDQLPAERSAVYATSFERRNR